MCGSAVEKSSVSPPENVDIMRSSVSVGLYMMSRSSGAGGLSMVSCFWIEGLVGRTFEAGTKTRQCPLRLSGLKDLSKSWAEVAPRIICGSTRSKLGEPCYSEQLM